MKRQKRRPSSGLLTRKRLLLAGGVLVAVLLVGNGVLWAVYRDRTYPRTRVMGSSIGSVPYAILSQKVSERHGLPDELTLAYQQIQARVPIADLGITKDVSRTTNNADRQRSWLPMLDLFRNLELQAPVRVDPLIFDKKAAELGKTLRKEPLNAHLNLEGTTVGITEGQTGFELGRSSLQAAILKSLDKGKAQVAAPVITTQPKLTGASLKAQQTQLRAELATAVTYRYGNKSKQVPPSDIAGWFVPANNIYELAPAKVQAYVVQVGKEFGIRVKDPGGVAASTTQSVSGTKPLDITLVHQAAVKTYTYCTAGKGVDAAHLSRFRSKLLSTLNDSRSWSLDGLVEFKEASSGCNFTAWLSAAELMPTFGGVCDAEWSCRSGANVVVNFTRWQNASPAWNTAGGALDEYRNMVINHETGHWLGFGHDHCGGAGQPAPVMQQQSIDLQGCTFNAWPTAGELASWRRTLGL